ncbi:hypothetical protein [Propionicimonas sp.]|uniref:hypothetical protein n=1 Tax=Propionicimonas sp. TaxID=1955623 RepID=UPI0018181E25|nr:hypothetical protein [Propionicimonas sp.]MBU3975353.1 hypothetical protein [Actinomycetota bacterium]MBA3020241.1 hypothetical protein [Propionicimonas sp.]MBU3986498.1 hypothetical protein [Actinomycetota bacterium]MBU4008067.1 hypothetical protein [Actinomycetota bacterium]MBU4064325.1 hypothetical protein [Actinomycetota bacterium]
MTPRTAPPLSAERLAGITIRTAHIAVTSIYVGGRLWDVPAEKLRLWRNLTTVTGVALLISEIRHSPNWAHQGRGLTTMVHLGALLPGHLWPQLAKAAPVAAMLVGSIGSHLPRALRKWSFLERRILP